jgi:hypothetical protein
MVTYHEHILNAKKPSILCHNLSASIIMNTGNKSLEPFRPVGPKICSTL